MKKFYDRFIIRLARICKTNIFGQMSNVLLFGGLLLTCCGVFPSGIGCLAFAGLGYLLSAGKVALEDHEASQEQKYYTEEDYETEDYSLEKTNKDIIKNIDNEKINKDEQKVNEQMLKNIDKENKDLER